MWIYANDRLWNLDRFVEIYLDGSTVKLIDDERYVHYIESASVELGREVFQEILGKLTNSFLIHEDSNN